MFFKNSFIRKMFVNLYTNVYIFKNRKNAHLYMKFRLNIYHFKNQNYTKQNIFSEKSVDNFTYFKSILKLNTLNCDFKCAIRILNNTHFLCIF
jgi:hypothetical protein